MSHQLIRRVADAVTTSVEGAGLSRREVRDLQKAVDRQAAGGIIRAAGAQADGYVANTVVETAAFVTNTGLSRVAALSRREEDLIREAPLGESRYQAIVNTYASLVANEIAELRTR